MHYHSRLSRLFRPVSGRLALLESLAISARGKCQSGDAREVSFAAIELQTLWANFSRSYYLSVALASPILMSGGRITYRLPPLVSEREALLFAVKHLDLLRLPRAEKGNEVDPRFEPPWHDKITLIKLTTELGASNASRVIDALSYPTSFFESLPPIRNFYAHRNLGTLNKVRNMALQVHKLPDVAHPTRLINELIQTRSETLLVEWIGDVRAIVQELCA